MHSYVHNRLLFSFYETWIYNHVRNPDRVLRNANDMYVPAHNFATVKRFPLFSFPLKFKKILQYMKNNKSA
jgi:hypothetical protein